MLVLRLVLASGSWPQKNVIYDYQTSINPCISRLGRSCVLHCYSMRLTNPSEWVYLIIIGMLLCGKISASNLWSSCTSSISNVIFQTYDIKNVAKNSWVCSINKTKQLQNCWWNIRTDVCISQETQCKKKKRIDSREIEKFSAFQITPTGLSCSVLASALGWKSTEYCRTPLKWHQ